MRYRLRPQAHSPVAGTGLFINKVIHHRGEGLQNGDLNALAFMAQFQIFLNQTHAGVKNGGE